MVAHAPRRQQLIARQAVAAAKARCKATVRATQVCSAMQYVLEVLALVVIVIYRAIEGAVNLQTWSASLDCGESAPRDGLFLMRCPC